MAHGEGGGSPSLCDAEPDAAQEQAQRLRLQHTQEDADTGRRALFPNLMDAWPCHQDVQISNGEALLLQYVTKYVSKFSDSNYDDWMSDEASADCVEVSISSAAAPQRGLVCRVMRRSRGMTT